MEGSDDARVVVGVDEAGRGPCFGPVYAGAVIWPPGLGDGGGLIRDSKKLTPKQLDRAYAYVKDHAIACATGSVSASELDRIGNMTQTTHRAMHRAIQKLRILPDHLLVDGNLFTPYQDELDQSIPYTTLVKGDSKFISIAAASILAKVERDRWVVSLCEQHPDLDQYKIRSNKGYGQGHIELLKVHGLTPWHRRSFKCCRDVFESPKFPK